MENLANYYYQYHYGVYNYDTEKEYKITENTIAHLIDNEIPESTISGIIRTVEPGDYLSVENLPNELWTGSLLKRDTFYYHKELRIKSEAPIYNKVTREVKSSKFFLEMKIQYTLDNLLSYYQKKAKTFDELLDRKRDLGALEYLLTKYSKVSFIEPIDFVLSLIDTAGEDTRMSSGVLDLQRYENETYEHLKRKAEMARAHKHNIIIWRG